MNRPEQSLQQSIAPMVSFVVPGKPIAWARARTNGKVRFTPEPQASYMTVIGTIARTAMSKAGYQPFSGPVELQCRATFAYPAKWPQKRRDATRRKTSKPDLSNIIKIVEDSMNGIVMGDDAQVASLIGQKLYGDREEVVITVSSIDEAEAA